MPSKLQPKRMPLKSLSPYLLQQTYYGDDTTAADDEALAADLRDHGQRDPIVVMPPKNAAGLPAYTILDGHRRANLLATNSETEAKVVIRHDLADADAATVETEFLKINSVRRQLHPVDQVRIELRLEEVRQKKAPGKLGQESTAKVRDQLAKKLNMTSRNAGRYVRLAATPIEVQRAVRDGRVSLVVAEKVCDLSKTDQAEIAKRIRKGEPPKVVITEHVGSQSRRHRKPMQALAAFVRGLRRGLDDLDGRLDRICGPALEKYRPILEHAHDVIGQLLDNEYESSDDDRAARKKDSQRRKKR